MIDDKELTCSRLFSTYRDNFEHGRIGLKTAFKRLLKLQEPSIPLYDIESATILNSSILAAISMMNNKVAQCKTLHPLYNSLKSGSSFNRLSYALVGYSAPTFLLIRHSFRTTDGKTLRGIIGAYVSQPWKDELGYWGDN